MTVALHIVLAPEYRIEQVGLGWELQVWGFRDWHTLFEAPTMTLCEKAYMLHQEGWETLPDWEELE